MSRTIVPAALVVAAIALLAAFGGRLLPPAPAQPELVRAVGGFSGPESVRHDPDQDVFFVSNFNGRTDTLKNTGFISRMTPDGEITALRFIAGGRDGVVLHSPRGMALRGDTLWAADLDAVRGFHRRTGAPLATVSFAHLERGFLNDVTVGPDGALYVTDTGRNLIYRVAGGAIEVALADTALGGPNGITWDAARNRFLVLPFRRPGLGNPILAWRPGSRPQTLAAGTGGGYDGVEVWAGDSVLVTSQRDSSLQVFTAAGGRIATRLAGRPADLGVHRARRLVALPYVARDTVEIWRLP